MYNVLLNVLPAGKALERNARIPHNDCNCFKVTFLEKAMRFDLRIPGLYCPGSVCTFQSYPK
jgi:hypothetical protein